MQTRRQFLQQIGLSSAMLCAANPLLAAKRSADQDDNGASNLLVPSNWRMPDEAEAHSATWMAFGASERIWGRRLLRGVQSQLANIANTIAAFEPVNMLVSEKNYSVARGLCHSGVNLIVQEIDDLWMRDTGAVFVKQANGQLAGIDFHFNGWGKKQKHQSDAKVAAFMQQETKVQRLPNRLVLEGGSIEVDGEGTAIMTESCVLNRNRNPGLSRARCEAQLKPLLGVSKIIWLPGIAGKDITDGHTDFYARFASPGVVIAAYEPDPEIFDHDVTQRHLAILRNAVDAKGRKLEVVVLPAPDAIRSQYESDDFAAGYVNFYVCNGAVLMPQFGDRRADSNAYDIMRDLFPRHEVIQLNIDAIAAGGGGIHCTTQQQPA